MKRVFTKKGKQMEIKYFIKNIENLIAAGETDIAIVQILQFANLEIKLPHQFKDKALKLSSRFSYFSKRFKRGLISDVSELNLINSELISLLGELKYFQEHNGVSRMDDEISALRQRHFHAKTALKLREILADSKKLKEIYPNEYGVEILIEEIEKAIKWETNKLNQTSSSPLRNDYARVYWRTQTVRFNGFMNVMLVCIAAFIMSILLCLFC